MDHEKNVTIAPPRPRTSLDREDISMNANASSPPDTQLFDYRIASADMFYAEVGQRNLHLHDNPDKGIQIWDGPPSQRMSAPLNLCQVLLEYAMTCAARADPPQAYCEMEEFGRQFGQALALRVMERIPTETVANRAATALQWTLWAMNAHFTVEQSGFDSRYVLDCFPLREASDSSGLRQVDLAHHGVKVLCQSLLSAIDPYLTIRRLAEARAGHTFWLVRLFPR